MEKTLNKIKAILSALLIAMVSFSEKIFWQEWVNPNPQPDYWIYFPWESLRAQEATSITTIRIVQILLVILIFIVWVINLIKIRKVDDKTQRGKKIRNTIIIIAILVLILIASFVIPARLPTR